MVSVQMALLALAVIGANPAGGQAAEETVLLDFTATWCGPCRQMEPTVAQFVSRGYPIRKVDIDQQPELAAQYRITGVPCFVMLVNGQEVGRHEGLADASKLEQLFRQGQAAVSRPRALGRGRMNAQSPDTGMAAAPSPDAVGSFPTNPRSRRGAASGRATFSDEPDPDQTPDLQPVGYREPQPGPGPSADPFLARGAAGAAPPVASNAPASTAPSSYQPAENPSQGLEQRALESSVRLRIQDDNGHSIGSGTIIDTRSGEALILTCGHIFRDSQGKGEITIDLFGAGAPQGLRGKLIRYDLERDLGLITFKPGVPVTPARVVPVGYSLRPGDPVVNVGCNHGEDATARASSITAVDKFLGPPNVQVAGQPVQGRSGGGLFNADGLVIGVCNAADPSEDQGLYAAVDSIHAQLQEAGILEFCVAEPNVNDGQVPMERELAVDNDPNPREEGLGQAELASYEAPVEANLSADDQQALSAAMAEQGEDAEVICIVRSLSDPRGKSRVIVLDKASPGFMRQLEAEEQVQGGRAATRPETGRSPTTAARPRVPVQTSRRLPGPTEATMMR